jgi:hypothetical protein
VARRRASRGRTLAHSESFSLCGDDRGVVGESVEQRRRQVLVAGEDPGPLAEAEVGRHDDRAALITLGHDAEEQLAALAVEWHEAEFVEDEQGSSAPRPKSGGTPSTISAGEISELLGRVGDPTRNELTAAFNRGKREAARLHVSSMKRALSRHGYIVKKSAGGHWRVFGPPS